MHIHSASTIGINKKCTKAKPEEVARWEMQIAEVATNTFQHGKVDAIWIVGQSYPEKSVVQLAAIDHGATIPAVITPEALRVGRWQENNDADLIAFACKPGITSRCVRQNQGAGLVTLIESVVKNFLETQVRPQIAQEMAFIGKPIFTKLAGNCDGKRLK